MLVMKLGEYSTTLCTSGERGVSTVVTVLGEMTISALGLKKVKMSTFDV